MDSGMEMVGDAPELSPDEPVPEPPPVRGRAWREVASSGALSLAALVLVVPSLLGSQVVQYLVLASIGTTSTTRGQLRAFAVGHGGLALLGALVAAAALRLGRHDDRSWPRVTAGAALVVGLVVIAVAVATYVVAGRLDRSGFPSG